MNRKLIIFAIGAWLLVAMLDGDDMVWDRTFGRLRNTVVLPQGWYLTALSAPSTIQTLPDGRVAIYVVNPRNDDVRVYLRARRRTAQKTS